MATMGRGAGELLRRLWAQAELSGVLGLGGTRVRPSSAPPCANCRWAFPSSWCHVASGNMRPYIGSSDIAVLFSVADFRRPEPGARTGAAKRGGGDRRHGFDAADCRLIRQAFGGNHGARKHPPGGCTIGGNSARRGIADCGLPCFRGLRLSHGTIDSRRPRGGGAGAYAA